MSRTIDLRSDTLTLPGEGMREVMAQAELGDDVYGEDPSVNALQDLAADMLGKEAALFAPSGTQTNLLALMSHCQRGDEYIVGNDAHTYVREGGGAAVLGSIQPQPIDFEADGTLDLNRVEASIKPDDNHFAMTRLLCLENTRNGLALPLAYLGEARALVDRHGLGLHLDGARVFNAAIKQQVPVTEISRYFDSVSVCLSKGLGSPVGSVLCGSKALIARAHRLRKMLGGGMRQAGMLGAAGIYALRHNVERLAEDHANAVRLARGLTDINQLVVSYPPEQTNMVFLEVEPQLATALEAFLRERNIVIEADSRIRLVTHLDISAEDAEHVVDSVKSFFTSH